MIRISFNNSDEKLVAALQARGPQIVSAIQEELDRLMFELLRRVQAKLSGEVLHQRTGKLLSSIVKQPTIIAASGKQIIGSVSGAGGPAFYGRFHETGTTSAYEIRPTTKQALAFFPTGSTGAWLGFQRTRFMFGKRGFLRPSKIGAFEAAGGIVVKKVVHPPIQQRSFMSAALEEMRAEIIARIYRAAAAAAQSST
jgi:hypothetical protein